MWGRKEDQPSESASEACSTRALHFLQWLMARPEKRIAVVSHWVCRCSVSNTVSLRYRGTSATEMLVVCLPLDRRFSTRIFSLFLPTRPFTRNSGMLKCAAPFSVSLKRGPWDLRKQARDSRKCNPASRNPSFGSPGVEVARLL